MTGMLPGTVGHCNPRSGTWLVASARNLRFFVSRRIPMRPNGLRPVPCEQVCAFAIQGCSARCGRDSPGQPVKDCMRGSAAQALAKAAVEAVLRFLNLLCRDHAQLRAPGKVLANQPFGGLVQASLPGMTGRAKQNPTCSASVVPPAERSCSSAKCNQSKPARRVPIQAAHLSTGI